MKKPSVRGYARDFDIKEWLAAAGLLFIGAVSLAFCGAILYYAGYALWLVFSMFGWVVWVSIFGVVLVVTIADFVFWLTDDRSGKE